MISVKYLLHHLTFCLCFIAVVQPAPKKEGDFVVGGLFPVSFMATSGARGPCGELNTKGLGRALSLIFAIENINSDSNILPNITLGYDIRAYCENATEATRLIYDLVKERCCKNSARQKKMGNRSIVALIGPEESSTALVIGGFLEIFNVSGISGTTTSPELSANLNNFYRTVPSDNFRVKAMADIIEHFNWSYVAAVGIYDSYGRSGVWGLVEEAVRRDNPFCIAMTELITQEAPRITDVVTKLRWRENIKVIVLWTYGNVQRMFFREVNRQNLSGRVWILSEVTFSSNENYFPKSGLSPLHGSIAFQPHNFDDGGFKQHLTRLLASGANEPNYPKLWGQVKELKEVCSLRKEKDISPDNDQTGSCLQETVDDMYSSYIPYIIDAVHSVAHALDMLTQNFTSHQILADVNLDNMKTMLSKVRFDGLTGEIVFDELGDRQTAVYDIVNFQQTKEAGVKRLDQVIVGIWDANKGLHLHKNVHWTTHEARPPKSECSEQCMAGKRKSTTSPCCWKCVLCPRGTVNTIPGSESCTECPIGKRANKARTVCEDLPLANLSYSSAGGITIIAFGAAGIILTLFSFAVFCRFWNTPIVLACNRKLSLALLVAIVLLLSLAFINLFKPTVTFCKIIYPWRFLTYNLCLSVVLVKVLGISVVFKVPIVPGFTIRSLTSRIQAMVIITLHVLLVFPLLFWLILDPPDNIEHIYPEQYIFIECKAYNMNVGKSLFMLTSSYIFIQMLLSAFCSFKVRNIPENFSEAKRIAFSLYILLFSVLAYYPIEFSMHGWYVSVVNCVTSLLSAYGFLCCIFLPKIYIILFKPELNTCAMVGREVTQFSFRTSFRGANVIHVNPAFSSSSPPEIRHNQVKPKLNN